MTAGVGVFAVRETEPMAVVVGMTLIVVAPVPPLGIVPADYPLAIA